MNISDYRREFAAYNSALELAQYEHRAGFEAELHTRAIYERYCDLFTKEAIASLERALKETHTSQETERAGLHALLGAARVGYLEAHARELTDERARSESEMRITWDGESVTSHSVPRLLANEPVASRRRELTARWMDAVATCNDLRAARFESFYASARSLGLDSYQSLFADITGTDYERLNSETNAFLQRTERAYASALSKDVAKILPGVALGELEHSDFFFFQRMSRLDQFFPTENTLAIYAKAMNALGIRVEQQKNIQIDNEPRPLKHPRAACFRINPPDDVRLLLAPVGGPYDYMVLFHETGHAQHFGWSSRDLMRRYPEFIYAPDYATTESYAFLFNHLFQDSLWLGEHLGITNEDRAREISRSLALLILHNVRRYSAKLSYELELHKSESNLRSERLAASYVALQREATLFRRSPALYLSDVDDGFYSAAYLRAWAFEASLREHLRTRYGHRWWASRKAGDELIDLWNTSSRYSVEELAGHIGFGEISFELLADTLIAAVSEA